MGTILLTGFEAFKDYKTNPTVEVSRVMDNKVYEGDKVTSLVLPVQFKNAAGMLAAAVDELTPYLVLSLGVSKAESGTRREDLNLEKRGRNIMNAKNPDTAGYAPDNELITPDSPEFYETMFALNGEELAQALAENGVRARTSDDAAGYVCNDLIYRTAEKISRERLETKFGFVHMPWLEGYPDVPEGKAMMPLDEIVKGLELIIERS